ncbi:MULTISPECIES: hypothetical protein [unclassified Pseudomonas]|jgi:hypothetical protein|uniref:hypothetical protein n=1 Tax=unclassified Pseudomonas TaxID=196821 RepID=UPI001056CFAE|nr:hypothetical protein [Pseudomonas sp. MS-1(2024)]MEC4168014.1 hypothetical protein [Pseudomonas sp. MS-1(2024)]
MFDDQDSPEKSNRDEIARDGINTTISLSTSEVVSRFGSANAEYLKGYSGVDNETQQKFAKGLAGIAKHKVNADPRYAEQNIKQQAGYSAEVAATSRDNAESIINGSKIRVSRSDDLPEYGKNHTVVDRVQLLDGEIIQGTQTQMKFVGKRDELFAKIAKEDGEFTRYRGVTLELPSEQYVGAESFCRDKAQQLRDQAAKVEQLGKDNVAKKLRHEADNYEQLADHLSDSGLTTDQAIFYRTHPKMATAMDIARTSHRAGLQGAQYGAAIGGSISLLQNLLATAQGQKEMGEAAQNVAVDTLKAGALGYGTAFVGAAIKGSLQQSGNSTLRSLAGTSAPALAVNICLSLASSINRYVCGEISEAQLLSEVGEKGAGMLSSSMMAALGQLAIPVPFVGAAIGAMIGYTLSSLFYQSALDAARGAELSREQLARTRFIEAAARDRIAQEQAQLDDFTRREIPQLQRETLHLFSIVNAPGANSADCFAAAINQYATLLGKQLQFHSIDEFNDFMSSDSPLSL